MNIVGLGYVGLAVPDVAAWQDFGCNILGLSPGKAPGAAPWLPEEAPPGVGQDGSFYFRIDGWSWRLAVHPADTPGLQYLGLEVAGPDDLKQALSELSAAGVPAREGSADECRARAVSGLVVTEDPGGHQVEIFYGPRVADDYSSPYGMEFLTGTLGMGHVNLFASDFEKSRSFYTDLLGFRLTDYYQVGEGQTVNFFHINPRHHTVGLMQVAPFDGIHHIMLETQDIDMVGKAYDRVLASGMKVTASLGRHSNDQIISFYVESPSGVEVEIGWGAITVGPDWTPRYRAPGDIWGHHGLTAENIEKHGKRA